MTLRAIASRAGCAHTNVYNYFPNLESLYWEALLGPEVGPDEAWRLTDLLQRRTAAVRSPLQRERREMMVRQTKGLVLVFGFLLVISLGGILYHQLTGYPYPASPAFDFEFNVLNDPYEAFFLLPAGLLGLWALRKQNVWGPVLIGGTALTLAYNYLMLAMGRQNLWVFLWTAKLALAGTAVCLVWSLLPSGPGRRSRQSVTIAAYLALTLILFSGMMGQRLLASATGRTVDMSLQGAGSLDWGEPFLRDPIVFFALSPLHLAAILGLWRGAEWGGRAAALSLAFNPFMVSAVLFTGPLKEYLQKGAVSPAMWAMSVIMVLFALPAVWALAWLVRGRADA